MYLDLTSIEKPTLTVKLTLNNTDTEIHLFPVSRKMIDKLSKFKNTKNTVENLYQLVAEVLSCNTDGREVTVGDISGMSVIEIRWIFTAYRDFIKGIGNDPN